MRKHLTIGLAIALALAIVGAAVAANTIVKVNGKTVRNDVAPFARHGTQFVQIQPVCKAAGAKFEWDKDANRVTICRGETCTSFKIGDGPKDAYVKSNHPTAAYKELAKKLGGTATYDSTGGVISYTVN